MGYETQIQFVGVELRKGVLEDFIRQAELARVRGKEPWSWMVDGFRIDTDMGYLDWNLGRNGRKELSEHAGEPPLKLNGRNLKKVTRASLEIWWDGTSMPSGKWYQTGPLVRWIYPFCESGMILQVSVEGDGAVWGWELDRRKGIRYHELIPVTRWRRKDLEQRKPAKGMVASRPKKS